MAIVPIPATVARLQPYIVLKAEIGGHVRADINDVPTPGAYQEIASVTSISNIVAGGREVSVWRAFNEARAGLPVEAYPNGLPNYSFTLGRIMLNNSVFAKSARADSIMETFGFYDYNNGFDLIAQFKPLNMQITLLSPRDASGTPIPGFTGPVSMTFEGVWLGSFTLGFDAETSAPIMQSVPCTAANLVVSQ